VGEFGSKGTSTATVLVLEEWVDVSMCVRWLFVYPDTYVWI